MFMGRVLFMFLGRCGERKGRLLFVNKKKQKNFVMLGSGQYQRQRPCPPGLFQRCHAPPEPSAPPPSVVKSFCAAFFKKRPLSKALTEGGVS
jgi:hypothetical protein